MTQEEIIEMARQANFAYEDDSERYIAVIDDLQDFAKLVAAKEREACANLCWKNQDDNAFVNAYNGKRLDLLCSELIRTRGKND
jgi:hypothetical protein